jgi:hypothetical protein
LPRTDFVIFTMPSSAEGKGHTMKIVAWETACAIGAGLMAEVPDGYPVRYRVRDFPSMTKVMELRAAEI